MKFAWDAEKSKINKRRRGLSFGQAEKVFLADHILVSAKTVGENRMAAIGMIEGKLWTVIFTLRGGYVRIISARRSDDHAKQEYQKKFPE